MTQRNQRHKRPRGLVAIVIYKSLIAGLLAIASVALLLAIQNYQSIDEFANQYVLEGKREIIRFILSKFLSLNPKSLQFSGIFAGVYAVVTAIEAVGLWYEKKWASLLVIALVGISLPLEVWELIKGISPIKLIVFVVNLAIFLYLLFDFKKTKQ
ncbi:DUF2127 domain-containing protein [Microseira sp. BLCC-F43]|jgi:uncharacterized membrane protein (DUF2068 family)|uniref:DUF2127 domain-containing protein n=1 Tax=Microseira sp. BLCC-F43 TaxID=3153602 RepID=UPI0035BB2844